MRKEKVKFPPLQPDPNQRWFDPGTAATYLGLSVQTVRNLLHAGQIKAVRFGNLLRIDRIDLDQWMSRRKSVIPPYRRGTHPWVTARHEKNRKQAAR